MSPLIKTFKRGNILFHCSELTYQYLKKYASSPRAKEFQKENGTGIFHVGYPRVDDQKPSLALRAGWECGATLLVLSTFVRKGRMFSLVKFCELWL